MRWLFSPLLPLLLVATLSADTFVYVSKAPEKQIQIYKLDAKEGKLSPVDTVDVAASPGSLAVDPQKKFLFASLRTSNSIAGFRIDAATGKLKPINSVQLDKGANAAFVATDRTGRWLLSASYSGGKVAVHKLKDDGTIEGQAVQTITTAPTAHSIGQDPAGAFVFVPHVTPNAVYQFSLDAKTGMLTESGKAAGGADKAGPRHIAFHPKLPLAFTSDEVGNSITAYAFDPKTGLKPVQTLPTLPDDFKGKNTTAEVKAHPNGKFVWVSNRGHDSLAGFAIDDAGKLNSIGQTPTEKTPRSFDIDPDGRYVFGAGEGTGKLAVYGVDLESGKLSRLHTVDVGKSLTWVLAVKLAGQ